MPIEHSSNTNWLINQNSEKNQLPSYPNKLYIGIDFGTSTTVVSLFEKFAAEGRNRRGISRDADLDQLVPPNPQ